MGTTTAAILIAARAKLAATPTSRDAAQSFLEHTTNQPFEKSPIGGRDGFEVVERDYAQTSGFGVLGEREAQFMMVVRLGHAPFGPDKTREENRVADEERIADILEAYAWPAGTFTVLHHHNEVNKEAPNWWITELFFKVVYVGSIRT